MNTMDKKPVNISRVMLISNGGITLEFGLYKDGMFKPDGSSDWYLPNHYDGWVDIKEIKSKLNIH